MTTTSAREWREKRKKGIEFELPEYQDIVLIRPMDAEFFFKLGGIPDFLAPTVRKIINGNDYSMPLPPEDQSQEDLVKWLAWLDELVTYALVSPKVVSDPQGDDQISIDEIGYIDKLRIYKFFGWPAQQLRRFREQQTNPVAVVDAPKNNGAAAKQVVARASVGQSGAGDAG